MAMKLNGIRVYVAGPYSNPDPIVNTRRAIEVGNELMEAGYVPFVPHLTLLFHMVCPRPYEDWLTLDNEWVKVCHAVLRMEGASSGADKEEALARSLGIPVYHSIAELAKVQF